jgi:hypothetical protein
MHIEYTTPQADYLDVAVTLTEPDGTDGAAECVYKPEPVVGLRMIPAGKFKAIGRSGRVEEAVVLFDIRKSEFVIQPKKLVAGGFDFDKPVSDGLTPDTAAEIAATTGTK